MEAWNSKGLIEKQSTRNDVVRRSNLYGLLIISAFNSFCKDIFSLFCDQQFYLLHVTEVAHKIQWYVQFIDTGFIQDLTDNILNCSVLRTMKKKLQIEIFV